MNFLPILLDIAPLPGAEPSGCGSAVAALAAVLFAAAACTGILRLRRRADADETRENDSGEAKK